MRKWPKTESEDIGFVRKYCLANTYPASDERCPYAKAKIIGKSSQASTGKSDLKNVDGIFLCKYPDRQMPTHEASLTSELDQCPYTERRNLIDAQFVGKV
ncbi:MAG: hypothetical protein JSV14_08835 [Deltaproteobacteria bacterium]|nr:MAG: hypothetical protein JSV14_08835 [Deltaproteobacteria bacterium]